MRDSVENLSAQTHHLYHLGSTKPSHSNLSRIIEDKPYGLYEALFGKLLQRCQGVTPGQRFRFKHPLYSRVASTIDLCLSIFPWAEFVTVTDGKAGGITVGRTIDFPGASSPLAEKEILFVTRLKSNTETRVIKHHTALKSEGLTCD